MLPEVSGVPGEVKIRSKEETEIAQGDEPHVQRKEDLFPGSGELSDGRRFYVSASVEAADAGQFRAIHAFVIFGEVPIKKIEGNRPHDAQRAEDVKNGAPAEREQNAAGDKWRDGHGEAAEEMRGALDAPPFDARKPELHPATGDGESARFAESQKEASAKKRTEAERRSGHNGGSGP